MICFTITSLPPTDNHCQKVHHIPDILYNTFIGFISAGGASVHCGDLIFSGHEVNILTSMLTVWTYGQWGDWRHRWAFRLTTASTVLSWLAIVASRSHYSVDVLLAIIVVPFVWRTVPDRFPSRVVEVQAWARNCWDPTAKEV
eukprot:PhF_6_TR15684/c0_g1_i1/m.24391